MDAVAVLLAISCHKDSIPKHRVSFFFVFFFFFHIIPNQPPIYTPRLEVHFVLVVQWLDSCNSVIRNVYRAPPEACLYTR